MIHQDPPSRAARGTRKTPSHEAAGGIGVHVVVVHHVGNHPRLHHTHGVLSALFAQGAPKGARHESAMCREMNIQKQRHKVTRSDDVGISNSNNDIFLYYFYI